MVTGLEIADSAVKIGLGALISSVATYVLARRNHKHEMRKFFVQDKTQILRDIALKLEKSSSTVNNAYSVIADLRRNHSVAPKDFDNAVRAIDEAFNHAKEARALCYLVGEKTSAALVRQYLVVLKEMIDHFCATRLNYDHGVVNEAVDKMTEVRTQIVGAMGEAFEATYR